jgi:ATP-dependent Clp protease adaptor protein ClpS
MTTPANPRPEIEEKTRESADLGRLYHLVLLDDSDHSYEYVVYMLGRIFGYAREKAFAIACAVDSTGRAVVETADHERVSRHQQQIHAFGPDPVVQHSKGSMSAVIEPAP